MTNFKDLVRLAKTPETFTTKAGKSGVRLLMAISRPYSKNRDESAQNADFIHAVAYGSTADFIVRNADKGSRINVTGSLRADRYVKDGATKYSIPYILVDEVVPVDFKKTDGGNSSAPPANNTQVTNDDGWGEDIPF